MTKQTDDEITAPNRQDTTETAISVLIVDDHPAVCDGLKGYLEIEPDIHVVGCSYSGEEAIQIVKTERPDIVLMDLEFQRSAMNGNEATKQIKAICPSTRVIAVSNYSDQQHVSNALRAGVSGYLVKTSGRPEIIEAIRLVVRGKAVFDEEVQAIIRMFIPESPIPNQEAARDTILVEKPTRAEMKVLKLIADGMSNDEIAAALTIETATVKTHVSHILHKLNVKTREAAAVWYRYHYGATDIT